MEKLLEAHKSPKLIQEEIENAKIYNSKEIESVTKNLLAKTNPWSGKVQDQCRQSPARLLHPAASPREGLLTPAFSHLKR